MKLDTRPKRIYSEFAYLMLSKVAADKPFKSIATKTSTLGLVGTQTSKFKGNLELTTVLTSTE